MSARDVLVNKDGIVPCSVREERAAMTDSEWEASVFGTAEPVEIDFIVEDETTASPCTECGEVGPCATDAEGRGLFHKQRDDEDEGW